MKFLFSNISDIGRKRSQNQDSSFADPDMGLFIVADGMGGHLGGGTASSMVVQLVPESIRAAQTGGNTWDPKLVMNVAMTGANKTIYERAAAESNLQGMGTTTTALLFTRGAVTIGHVGDSRLYFFRPHERWQITRDHSLVEEKLRAGLISREDLKTDTMKNVITRSVGFEPEVQVDLYEMETQAGDVFLICSDGLSGMVDEKEMSEIVEEILFQKGSLEEANQKLITSANENGGDDNVTSILIQVLES